MRNVARLKMGYTITKGRGDKTALTAFVLRI